MKKKFKIPIVLICAALICFLITLLIAYLGGMYPNSDALDTRILLFGFIFGPISIDLFLTGIIILGITVFSKEETKENSSLDPKLLKNQRETSAASIFFSALSIICSFHALSSPYYESKIYLIIGGITGLIITINNIATKKYGILWTSILAITLVPIIFVIIKLISMF